VNYSQRPELAEPSSPRIEIENDAFVIGAELLGEILHVPAAQVPILLREGTIRSICERGIEDSEGEFRLTFFYRSRRARLSTDLTGQIIRGSVIDFGNRPLPDGLHRASA
jgi:hypothetical protein